MLFLFSHSGMYISLWLHGLQHTSLPCLSLSPRVFSNSCPLSWWYYLTISSCFPFSLLPLIFPSIRVFSDVSVLHIRWPKCSSYSVSLSNEYSGLISFRMDWFDLIAVQGTLKNLLQHHSSKPSILHQSASGGYKVQEIVWSSNIHQPKPPSFWQEVGWDFSWSINPMKLQVWWLALMHRAG